MSDALELPNGICDFTRLHRVTTYTSGNELPGQPVIYGDYNSERDAEQALADDGFTRRSWTWRKGYTDAQISKVIRHENYRDDLPPSTAQIMADERVRALVEAGEVMAQALRGDYIVPGSATNWGKALAQLKEPT